MQDKATQYLESQLQTVTTDPYALSIIAYALTLANSSSASLALTSLNALAINQGITLSLIYVYKQSSMCVFVLCWVWHQVALNDDVK